MATVKISELPAILGANTATTDVLPIVDVSGNITNKITREEFFKNIASVDINGGTIDGAVIGGSSAAAGSFTTVSASGNITVGGTVDGRDVATDGTKLDGIEAGAQVNPTASEIKTLYESNADTNAFTDAEQTKLSGIEAGADITDTTNVTAAGALMDSELTNIAAVKALNQGVATTNSPSFVGVTASGDVTIADKIVHAGDTNTAIRFPAADTVTVETSGAERLRVDSSGNVGIGTATPADRLDVANSMRATSATTASVIALSGNATDYSALRLRQTATESRVENIIGGTGAYAPVTVYAGGSERMRITSAGHVGIGTTSSSPSALLTIGRYDTVSEGGEINLCRASDNASAWAIDVFGSTSTPSLRFVDTIAAAERVSIDGSGNLLVGTGSTFDNVSFLKAQVLGGVSTKINSTAAASQISFFNPNGRVGFVGTSGTSTTYNTSSDYRLKENVQPMSGALDKITQLNPVTYTWKADGSAGQGFIAHELQAVVPDCVTGEKDAVDETGNPQYQGVDTSFLVATLVKAIQELKAEVDSLRAQLNP